MVWLLHNKFDNDPKIRELERNLQRMGIEYYRCSVIPFSDDGIIFESDLVSIESLRGRDVMIQLAISGKVKKVIVEHSDRLTRFNYKLIELLFTSHGVKVECIEEVLGKSFEDELVKDMLTLMASFSAKIYGKRSHQNRKKKDAEVVPTEAVAT